MLWISQLSIQSIRLIDQNILANNSRIDTILPGTAAGGEDENTAADEDANNSNSNAVDQSSKPASASVKSQHADDTDQSVQGRYFRTEYSLHH